MRLGDLRGLTAGRQLPKSQSLPVGALTIAILNRKTQLDALPFGTQLHSKNRSRLHDANVTTSQMPAFCRSQPFRATQAWSTAECTIAFAIASEFCKRPFARNFRSENDIFSDFIPKTICNLAILFAALNSQLFLLRFGAKFASEFSRHVRIRIRIRSRIAATAVHSVGNGN